MTEGSDFVPHESSVGSTESAPSQINEPALQSEVDAFRESANSRITGMVDRIISGEELSEDELHALQERKIRSLDPEDRDRIRNVKDKLAQLSERFGKRIRDLQFVASKKEVQAQQRQTFNDAACEEFQGDAVFLRDTASGLEQDWVEQQSFAYQEMWKDAEGGDLVKVDRFTGLKTRDSLLGRLSKNVEEWRKTGDLKYLRGIRVRAGDLDNFKQGNDIRGHDGFDEFLRDTLAYRMRQLAVYTGSNVYEDDLDERAIDEMFPQGSTSREKLDSLRGLVILDGYRMKSGADEIFIAYEKVDLGMAEEDFDKHTETADTIYNELFRSCVIGRYENPNETAIIRDKYIQSPRALVIRQSRTENGDYSMIESEAQYWTDCANEISLHLEHSGMGDPIVTNEPPTVLRMSAGITPARNLETAVRIFANGEGTTGTKVDVSKLRGGAGLAVYPEKAQEYDRAMRSSAVGRLAIRGASDREEVKEVLGRSAVDPITGYFLQHLMNEADEISKPDGKRELVVRTWTAQPRTIEASELALQLGSLAVAGRLEKAVASREERVDVLKRTMEVIEERARPEIVNLQKVLEDKGYTTEMLSRYADGNSIELISKIIQDAHEKGLIDKHTLYLYYGFYNAEVTYKGKLKRYEDLYKDKGVQIQDNSISMPIPSENKEYNKAFINAIRIARYLDYKESKIAAGSF